MSNTKALQNIVSCLDKLLLEMGAGPVRRAIERLESVQFKLMALRAGPLQPSAELPVTATPSGFKTQEPARPSARRRVIFRNMQSPGDIVMLTAAVRDLKRAFPEMEVGVETSAPALWENNPYITVRSDDKTAERFELGYPIIHGCNSHGLGFINGFRMDIEDKLGLRVPATTGIGDIHLSQQELSWPSPAEELGLPKDKPYWLINAGYKTDYTCKQWDFKRWEKVAELLPGVQFVQVGEKHPKHIHPELKASNVFNMVGKTTIRQFIRLVYHSFGAVTPVSFLKHLAVAVPPHPKHRWNGPRPTIVLMGGREPIQWQQEIGQHIFHTIGMLDCCRHGGCWKSRVVPLNDGDSKDKDLCKRPVTLESGQAIARCMDMISAEEVTSKIKQFMDGI